MQEMHLPWQRWSREKVLEIYNDWLTSGRPDVEIEAKYGFTQIGDMRKLFVRNGLDTDQKKQRICKVCGKPFVANSGQQMYCSKACYRKAARQREKEKKQGLKLLILPQRSENFVAIVKINDGAAKEHLNYGKYVAKYGL